MTLVIDSSADLDIGKKWKLIYQKMNDGSEADKLEFAKEEKRQFNHFRNKLKNSRTGKYFSPITLSNRLKELIEGGALRKTIIQQPKSRDTVGYEITEAGLKALKLSYKFEKELSFIFDKK